MRWPETFTWTLYYAGRRYSTFRRQVSANRAVQQNCPSGLLLAVNIGKVRVEKVVTLVAVAQVEVGSNM